MVALTFYSSAISKKISRFDNNARKAEGKGVNVFQIDNDKETKHQMKGSPSGKIDRCTEVCKNQAKWQAVRNVLI